MHTRNRTLLLAGLLVLAVAGLARWLAPGPVNSGRPAAPGGTADVTASQGAKYATQPENADKADKAEKLESSEEGGHPPADSDSDSDSEPAEPVDDIPAPQQPEPDYGAQIRARDLSPELSNLMQAAFVEYYRGNVEYAAMLSQDALAISDEYPAVKPTLYGIIGYSYEQLGYIEMAIEQYRAALAIYPLQRTSYDGMRRLDPEFAATHPKLLAKPAGKTAGVAEGTNNTLTE